MLMRKRAQPSILPTMTSSLRNSLHRKNHKERSQPTHRTKLGLLEKHGDYVKRARDYHSKKDRINLLRNKAKQRNGDEFYFGMGGVQTKGGVHIVGRGNEKLPVDVVKVLKGQDVGYVKVMRAANRKKITTLKEALQQSATLLVDLIALKKEGVVGKGELETLRKVGILKEAKIPKRKGKHLRFGERGMFFLLIHVLKSSLIYFIEIEQLEDPPSEEELQDLGWRTTSSTASSSSRPPLPAPTSPPPVTQPTSSLPSQIKELTSRLTRDTQLRHTIREFELQQAMMSKGSRSKILAGGLRPNEDQEGEDELDARMSKGRKGKDKRLAGGMSEKEEDMWEPRVYKWKLGRK